MPAQQPAVRRTGRSATTPDARPLPKDNRPGNKPKPERVAPAVRTRPSDQKRAEEARKLPQPFRALAYGTGVVIGTSVKVAEAGWNFAKRILKRDSDKR